VARIALIVNPLASGVTPRRLAAVQEELAAAGEVLTLQTQRPGHATELAAHAGSDAIVVFSGDGGYNEVLNGADGSVPVGFVPGGGTSVLPRALGLPRDAREAARVVAGAIREGRTRRITLGRVNGRRFGFAAGIGFDAELVRRVDELGRAADGRRAGDLAFVRAAVALALEQRGRFEPEIEIERLGRAAFVLVANGDPYSYAGPVALRISPEARFELGLDLAAPSRVGPAAVPRLVMYLLTGSPRLRRDMLHGHDLDRIEVRCDRPLPLQLDGEDVGDVTGACFEAERNALAVLA